MPELIGDTCEPSDLVIPRFVDGSRDSVSGAMFISGAKLYFSDTDGAIRLVTSS